MTEFFASMDSTQQVYWYIAIIASVIFIIQTIMTFVGADADTGVDADFDSNLDVGDHPFQLFSLRNLINFLLGFGWAGVVFYGSIDSQILLALAALLVGAVFIGIFFLIMRALIKLSEDNTFNIEDTVGQMADVYINIPAAQKGKGKVLVSIKGSTHELSAITAGQDDIKSGDMVKIVAIEAGTLLVIPLDK